MRQAKVKDAHRTYILDRTLLPLLPSFDMNDFNCQQDSCQFQGSGSLGKAEQWDERYVRRQGHGLGICRP